MQTLVRVVQAGSFTAAARSLGRSKARVSQTISALEAELGVVLLQRSTRSLGLTDAGRTYYHRCVDVLAEIDDLEASVTNERSVVAGTIRVTAPPGFAARYLHVLTSDFHSEHPGVVVDLDLTHRMVDLVEEGIDLAIRITAPRDSSLVARKLAPAPIIAVASPSYLEQHGRPRQPRDLTKHACLVDSNFRDRHRWPFRGRSGRETVTVSGPFRVNSPTAVRELAIAGHGVALVPRFVVAADLEARRLVELLRGKVALEWGIYAVYPRRDRLPRRVRAYVDHLARALPGAS